MGSLGRAIYTVGFWIRETGQAIDRLGCRLQGNYYFQEQLSRHRTLMNVFDKAPVVDKDAFVAPSASIIGDVQVGRASSIWYGCVLRGDVNRISIGSGTNIQDNSLVHVAKSNLAGKVLPTIIGDNVTVGHSAVLHGCTVENEAFVGMGATLLDGVFVEKHSMVAAGALVRQNTRIPCGEVWGGNPFQVTLFPNHGICIGFTNSHVVADGSTMFNFIRTWASIAKQLCSSSRDDNYDALLLEGLPFYDRNVIQDPKGLGTMFRTALERAIQLRPQENENPQSAPTDKVRATFIMGRSNIQGLKNVVSAQRPTLAHVSSFTVVCAYLWTCIAKTRSATGEGAHDADVCQHFGFPMECRARLDPPIPATYFGNCLVPCIATLKTAQLVGEEGLVTTAELIGKAIHSKVQGGVLNGADRWFEEFAGVMRGEWTMGVAGSPNLDYYNKIDFGWGKPKKFEFVEEPLSLSRCKDSVGDLEIGLIMPKNEMDLFSTIFTQGLIN